MSKKKTEKASAPEVVSVSPVDPLHESTEEFGNPKSNRKKKLFYPVIGIVLIALVGIGAMAKNGWFGTSIPENASSSSRNPVAAAPVPPVVTGTPGLLKEYIYAGSKLLAVDNAVVNGPGFEGDIASRQSGDGQVLSDDVAQIRKFLNGTDTPETAPINEFQRADMSPYADRGDGWILSDDVVQARRYQNGTNPLTAAAGPTQQAGNRATPQDDDNNTEKTRNKAEGVSSATELAVIKPVLVSRVGNKLTLGIKLVTNGVAGGGAGVSALSFTLNYNPAVLSLPNNCQPGDASRTAGEINILCNYGQPEAGFVGVVIDLEPDQTFSAGAQQIGLIDFTVAPGAEPTLAAFGFGDAPCRRSASNALGNRIMTTFTANTTSVTVQ